MDQLQSKNWWGRNWKWFVPVGCLSSLVLLLGFFALIITIVFAMLKSSDAYTQAISKARSNPAVARSLGSPLKEGYFISGGINTTGGTGNANLAVPISGPKGKGTLYVEATKSTGEWSYSKLVVQLDQTDERINLLNDLK